MHCACDIPAVLTEGHGKAHLETLNEGEGGMVLVPGGKNVGPKPNSSLRYTPMEIKCSSGMLQARLKKVR
jgi:hypothetical protein